MYKGIKVKLYPTKVTLEFCDNNCGDITVGERPCPYYIDDEFGSGYNCELKRHLGL